MFNNYSPHKYKHSDEKRPPCCTLKEFSQTNNTPYSTLYNRMKRTENKPEVRIQHRKNKYYAIDDLNNWHESFKKK